jgi:hypothetical protein
MFVIQNTTARKNGVYLIVNAPTQGLLLQLPKTIFKGKQEEAFRKWFLDGHWYAFDSHARGFAYSRKYRQN